MDTCPQVAGKYDPFQNFKKGNAYLQVLRSMASLKSCTHVCTLLGNTIHAMVSWQHDHLKSGPIQGQSTCLQVYGKLKNSDSDLHERLQRRSACLRQLTPATSFRSTFWETPIVEACKRQNPQTTRVQISH